MDAALFPLIDYLRAFIVVNVIFLVVHDQIHEALVAIHGLLGRVCGVEVKFFGLCRYIDMAWLLSQYFYIT